MSDQSPALPADHEPDDAFNQQLLAILDTWEAGKLPFRDAVEQLIARSGEAETAGHRSNQGRAELLLGVVHGYRANLGQSIRHFEKARALFSAAQNRKRAIGAMLNLGESYRLMGSFNRARQYFRAAYDEAAQLNAHDTQALCACNEGLLLISMNDLAGAQARLEQSLVLCDHISDANQAQELRCEIFSGMALIAIRFGQAEQAWEHAQRSLELHNEQPLLKGLSHRTFGQVVTAFPEPPTGFESAGHDPDEYFRLALNAYQSVRADGEQARTIAAQADSLAARGKTAAADRKYQQAIVIFTRLGMTEDASRVTHAQRSANAHQP